MSTETLERVLARLDDYYAAETAALKAQEYVIGQGATARRVTRADLAEIRTAITDLEATRDRLRAAAAGRRRVAYLRPF